MFVTYDGAEWHCFDDFPRYMIPANDETFDFFVMVKRDEEHREKYKAPLHMMVMSIHHPLDSGIHEFLSNGIITQCILTHQLYCHLIFGQSCYCSLLCLESLIPRL